ncbi:MAG: DUF1697 domain-containing protein [Flavipsychrobacter sp.]|nr:DUF1697 domain-containing protein [Flavipsychrobacter sp.]
MKRYATFLRGINVSGHNIVKMDVLKELFAMPGIKNIVTYIQSGNVIFDTKATDNAALERKIEKQLHKELGLPIRALVRSLEEIEQVIAANPFTDIPEDDNRKLYVTFLETIPAADKATALLALCSNGDELMQISGSSLYFLSPSYGKTKFSNNFVEKKLGVAATTRNWATLNKVIGL